MQTSAELERVNQEIKAKHQEDLHSINHAKSEKKKVNFFS